MNVDPLGRDPVAEHNDVIFVQYISYLWHQAIFPEIVPFDRLYNHIHIRSQPPPAPGTDTMHARMHGLAYTCIHALILITSATQKH